MSQKEWVVTLNTGAKMPAYGLGTWMSEPDKVGAAVVAALINGHRLIDCAHFYGNEAEIGKALQECFKEGVVKREDIFITSKLWSADQAPEDVLSACQLTLKNLQLEYLDLYLVHAPFRVTKGADFPFLDKERLLYDADSMRKCWQSMEGLVSQGLVKAIGISNFTITKTENLLKTAKIVPAVNQVECHPYFQQQKLKSYCDKKGIVIEVYMPWGHRTLPVDRDITEPVDIEDPVLLDIARKYQVKPFQVCISYALHRKMVVIPNTANIPDIEENYKATQITLTYSERKKIEKLDKNFRLLKFAIFLKTGSEWQEAWDIGDDDKYVV